MKKESFNIERKVNLSIELDALANLPDFIDLKDSSTMRGAVMGSTTTASGGEEAIQSDPNQSDWCDMLSILELNNNGRTPNEIMCRVLVTEMFKEAALPTAPAMMPGSQTWPERRIYSQKLANFDPPSFATV